MIRYALESCCFDCNSINFIGPFNHMGKFYKDASIVIPIQTSIANKKYYSHNYVHMLAVKTVAFLGPPVIHSSEKIAKVIFQSIFNTWPLFITALMMTITAGVIMWLLVSIQIKLIFHS